MSEPEFLVADPQIHRAPLLELNVEYLSWVFRGVEAHFGVPEEEIVGMSAAAYVPTVLDKVCGDPPPRGVFYLVRVGDAFVGMGGLRHLEPGVAEVKRIYVRPECRGLRLGTALLRRLLADAAAFGYRAVRLDTGPFMDAAHRLYESEGFRDGPPYAGVEVPAAFHARWRFLYRDL